MFIRKIAQQHKQNNFKHDRIQKFLKCDQFLFLQCEATLEYLYTVIRDIYDIILKIDNAEQRCFSKSNHLRLFLKLLKHFDNKLS